MSIEMENPETVLQKVDAAWNLVEQIRLAIAVGNFKHATDCIDRASFLLGNAVDQIQENEEFSDPATE